MKVDYDTVMEAIQELERQHFQQPCHPTRCSHQPTQEVTMFKLTDSTGDTTEVHVVDGEVHVKVQDQTLLDAQYSGDHLDTARGVYTLDQARQLRDALQDAIRLAARQPRDDAES